MYKIISKVLLLFFLIITHQKVFAQNNVYDYAQDAFAACNAEYHSYNNTGDCSLLGGTRYVGSSSFFFICYPPPSTHEVVNGQCEEKCTGTQERPPGGGACQDTTCPAGQSGNFTNSGSGWNWSCFDDPPPEECGNDDGKSPEQCACESGGGGWLSIGSQGDGECFDPPEDNQCDASSPDYKGTIDGTPVCTGDDEDCGPDGIFVIVNGVRSCVNQSNDPPDCGGAVATYDDQNGYECAQPRADNDDNQGPDNNELENDQDGDGTPDASDPDVDGDGTPNESDPDYEGQKIDTSELENKLDELRESQELKLENIGLKLDKVNQNLGTMKNKLTGIDDNVKAMSDYVTEDTEPVSDRTGDTPTISETSERIQNALYNHSFISSVMTIPTVSSSTSCPVYTLPATKFWTAIPINIHCTILEENRQTLSLLFTGLWTLMAAMVFLRA